MNKKIVSSLLGKKSELQRRISAIEEDFRKGRSQYFSEQTCENENNEVLNEIHHETKIELGLINQALIRFENKEYGFCSQCNGVINPKNLKISPYIDTCINCAK
ncbi:MAG: DnaK suppressor protein [Colwellia sp.]|jgi:DnaK suppressor protein